MDKPFKTIEEQVELLEARGVATDDGTPEVLLREGYYSVVNGYKEPFIDKEKSESAKDDRYLPGTSFADIYALFMFDRELRMLFQILRHCGGSPQDGIGVLLLRSPYRRERAVPRREQLRHKPQPNRPPSLGFQHSSRQKTSQEAKTQALPRTLFEESRRGADMGADEIPHTRAGVQVLLLPAGEHPERNRESVLVALRERPREADKDIAQAAQACLRPHQGFQEYLRARRAVLLRENISIARHCRDGRGQRYAARAVKEHLRGIIGTIRRDAFEAVE